MNWYLECLKKYAVFSGRACRAEYWVFTLINSIICMGLAVFEGLAGIAPHMEASILAAIFCLAVIVPCWTVTVRRLHDSNLSGWWLLTGAIPFVGGLIMLVLMLLPGNPTDNLYGPARVVRRNGRAPRVTADRRRQFRELGLSVVNNYQGRGINVGFGRGCRVSDSDIPALADCDLQELYLSRTEISDDSIGSLGEMKRLRILDVSGTKLTRHGVMRLKQLLGDTKVVG